MQNTGRVQVMLKPIVAAIFLGLFAPQGEAQQYYYQPPPSYYRNDAVEGTVVGGGLGAITGAVIGGRKQRGEGALIGAGVGALTGGLIGRSQDVADQRQAVVGSSVAAQANSQIAALAITNYDLVEMTRAGLSDELIISTLQSRGGRLDLSPNGLISLKQQGVSDRVVLAAQSMNPSGHSPAAAVVVGPPPPVVYVHPAPVVRFYSGPGWGHYPHHRHHYHYHRGW